MYVLSVILNILCVEYDYLADDISIAEDASPPVKALVIQIL